MKLSFFLILPDVQVSGYIVPRPAMPVPRRFSVSSCHSPRSSKVRAGIGNLWQELAALTVFAPILLAVSVRCFS
jgi:hypothetical protein